MALGYGPDTCSFRDLAGSILRVRQETYPRLRWFRAEPLGLVRDQADRLDRRDGLAGRRVLRPSRDGDQLHGDLVAGGPLERLRHDHSADVRGERVRRAPVELVREAVVRRAVAFVPVAAAVAEDREAARVSQLDIARGVGVGAR